MTTRHSLSVVVTLTCLGLVRCDNVWIKTRSNRFSSNSNLINIRFTLEQFKHFYECLCKVTTRQCSVQIRYNYWNYYYTVTSDPSEERVEHRNGDLTCNYYQCYYSWPSFVCTQEASISCQSSSWTQRIRYVDTECGGVSCVSITWGNPIEEVDYTGVQDKVTSCSRECECSRGVVSTPEVESKANPPTREASLSTTDHVGQVRLLSHRSGRGTSTRRQSMKRTTTRKPKSTKTKATTNKAATTTKTTAKSKTTITTTRTTEELHTPTPAKGTAQTTVSMRPSQENTNSHVDPTTEANSTAPNPVSDSQTHNDAVPIIAGVVVAAVVVAFIAAVSVILWKRRNGNAHTGESDRHEYANLPEASAVSQKSDGSTKVVGVNQGPSQCINYATVNGSFDYDQGEVKYDSLANQPYGNITAKVHADNQHYVNYEPNRGHTVDPVDGNESKETNVKHKDDYLTVTNTLDETDDVTTSIYSLAVHGDPGHAADVSGSNTETHLSNLYPQNSTNDPHRNATAAVGANTSHPFNQTDIKNTGGYSVGNRHDFAKPTVTLHSLDKAINPRQDYEFAKQTNDSISNNDYGYSLPNDDSNPDTTCSVASNLRNNIEKATASHPHVYSRLGKDNHVRVNPYDALQEVNEAPVSNKRHPGNKDTSQPHVYSRLGEEKHVIVHPYNSLKEANESHANGQANTKEFKNSNLSYNMDMYSVAEPVLEDIPQED